MPKIVEFGMHWEVYGRQRIKLPDYVDSTDEDAVEEYIRDNWDNIPLPEKSEYIPDSDYLEDSDDIKIIE